MPVEIGHEAPDFTLRDQHGTDVALSDFRGAKNVVLVFYPWAFSGICTGELGSIRDGLADLDNDETVTLAVSCDSMFANRAFAERDGYTFALLADCWPHGATAQAYGVFEEKVGVSLRGTFIIDKLGILRWAVVHGIGEPRDVDEYTRVLASI